MEGVHRLPVSLTVEVEIEEFEAFYFFDEGEHAANIHPKPSKVIALPKSTRQLTLTRLPGASFTNVVFSSPSVPVNQRDLNDYYVRAFIDANGLGLEIVRPTRIMGNIHLSFTPGTWPTIAGPATTMPQLDDWYIGYGGAYSKGGYMVTISTVAATPGHYAVSGRADYTCVIDSNEIKNRQEREFQFIDYSMRYQTDYMRNSINYDTGGIDWEWACTTYEKLRDDLVSSRSPVDLSPPPVGWVTGAGILWYKPPTDVNGNLFTNTHLGNISYSEFAYFNPTNGLEHLILGESIVADVYRISYPFPPTYAGTRTLTFNGPSAYAVFSPLDSADAVTLDYVDHGRYTINMAVIDVDFTTGDIEFDAMSFPTNVSLDAFEMTVSNPQSKVTGDRQSFVYVKPGLIDLPGVFTDEYSEIQLGQGGTGVTGVRSEYVTEGPDESQFSLYLYRLSTISAIESTTTTGTGPTFSDPDREIPNWDINNPWWSKTYSLDVDRDYPIDHQYFLGVSILDDNDYGDDALQVKVTLKTVNWGTEP